MGEEAPSCCCDDVFMMNTEEFQVGEEAVWSGVVMVVTISSRTSRGGRRWERSQSRVECFCGGEGFMPNVEGRKVGEEAFLRRISNATALL